MSRLNKELELAFNFAKYTDRNIFLTGKAGTGKTTFLHNLKKQNLKRMIVVAPTGVAAINAGGVTIHSFFQMPFGPIIPGNDSTKIPPEKTGTPVYKHFSKEKISIIKSLDMLVIDEISMVRADLLDGIDSVLRRYRDKNKAFGGVQVLMIGDLQQLAPVVKDDEWSILRHYYDTAFFFSSLALKKTSFISIILDHVYRQSDQEFIEMLNKIRNNKADAETIKKLNMRYIPDFTPGDEEGYIILTTHNAKAQYINAGKLKALPEKSFVAKGKVDGEFPEYAYPTDLSLELKQGAQVMFVKNDPSPDKSYYNGKIGKINDIDKDLIYVQCDGDDELIEVKKLEWHNTKYTLDEETKELKEKIMGSFEQYPLKLAWAITIHKSQGLTFEKAIIDARESFAHGQVYVALSRCKTLEGMVLSTQLSNNCFISDNSISGFTSAVEKSPPDDLLFNKSKNEYQQRLLSDLFDFNKIKFEINTSLNAAESGRNVIIGNLKDQITEIKNLFLTQINENAVKFNRQLNEMMKTSVDIESDPLIQDRVSKAASWFSYKLIEISEKIENLQVETDNQVIKKNLETHIEILLKESKYKTLCLQSCIEKFSVSDYLKSKARAVLSDYKTKKGKSDQPVEVLNNQKLYTRLTKWRNSKAKELDLPHYMVIQLKSLAAISNKPPINKQELKKVKGIGKRTSEKYGKELLEIILEYITEENIDTSKYIAQKVSPIPKISPTTRVSLEMFKEGLTIAEIAQKRNLTNGTIENHLGMMVESGELDIYNLIEKEKVEVISNYIKTHKEEGLKEAKEALGDDFTYNQIRCVRNYIFSTSAGKNLLITE